MNRALGARVATAKAYDFIARIAGSDSVASVGIGALGVGYAAAGGERSNKAVVCAAADAVAGVLNHALAARVAAAKARDLITCIAGPCTVTAVGVAALGVGRVATGGQRGDKAVIGAATNAVTGVLDHALAARVAAVKAREFIACIADPCTVAAVGIAALGVGRIATGSQCRSRRVTAGPCAIADVVGTVVSFVSTGGTAGDVVGQARTRTVTTVGGAAFGGGGVTTQRASCQRRMDTSAKTATDVRRAVVAFIGACGSLRYVIGLTAADSVAGILCRALSCCSATGATNHSEAIGRTCYICAGA